MDAKLIDKTCKRYCRQSLWLTVALALGVIVGVGVNWLDISLVNALAVSVIYTIVINFAYGSLWGRVAKTAPLTMTKFYLAASALRLITAAIIIVSFCMLVRDKDAIRGFVLLFFAFYMVMLIFDSVFFARVEKCNNLKTGK